MAASILSQDLMGVCLFMAKGNIKLPIEDVIRRIDIYQETRDRHFGLSRGDFRNLFQSLVYFEMELLEIGDDLNNIGFEALILKVLEYHDAFFNDEGVFWIKQSSHSKISMDSSYNYYWFGYSENEYEKKRKMKLAMLGFFENQDIHSVRTVAVRKFIKENEIDDSLLLHCSRAGKSS